MSLLRLMNHLDRDAFCPSVSVGRGGGAYESDLAEDVELHVLCESKVWSSTVHQLRSIMPLRRLIQRETPDVAVSVMDRANVALMLAVQGLSEAPRTVLSVQNNPRVKYDGEKVPPINRGIFFLMSRLYPYADRIVTISSGIEEELTSMIPSLQGGTKVIHNAAVDDALCRKSQLPLGDAPETASGEKVVVACGRLCEQKGFSFLLKAFARLCRNLPVQLWILGEGDKRKELERQARNLGIRKQLWMPGFVDNPYKYMAAADVFVLSSLWEGFGNVVAEAMACGTPVVTTDCPHGPGEIAQGGESGLLVPPADAEALADALQRMLTDDALRERYRTAGRERAEDFRADRIASEYGSLIQRVLT